MKMVLSAIKRPRQTLSLLAGASMAPAVFFAVFSSLRQFQTIQKPLELFSFSRWLAKRKLDSVMEIGTWDGGTLFVWSHIASPSARFISLDLNTRTDKHDEEIVAMLSGLVRSTQHVDCIRGNSHAPESATAVGGFLGGELLDFLFIDGDHTFAGVKRDFEVYSPFVRDGGVIAFHDIVASRQTEGVAQYWQEIKLSYEHVEFVDNRHSMPGCGIGAIIYARPGFGLN